MTKTDAAQQTLIEINPDVEIEAHTYNITHLDSFDHFMQRIAQGELLFGFTRMTFHTYLPPLSLAPFTHPPTILSRI